MTPPTQFTPVRTYTTVRPLGSLEQAFWLCDRNHPAHFALAAEVHGATTPAAWRAALDALQRCHPLLGVGIAPDQDGAPSFVRAANTSIPLHVLPRDEDGLNDWPAAMERTMAWRFLPGQTPLVRATLLHSPHATVCILAAHHSVADGISLTYLFRDLLQSLAGRALAPRPTPPSHEALLDLPAGVPPFGTASAAPTLLPAYRAWDGTPPRIDRLRLSGELSGELRTRARRESTTVHGALAAALACAQVAVGLPSRTVRVLSPIDTRALLGLGDECALVVEASVCGVTPHPGVAFWDLARQVTDTLAPARTLDGIRATRGALCEAMAGGLDVPAAAGLFAQAYGHDLLLSNLGPLRFGQDLGALRLEAVWGPAVLFGLTSAQTVGVTTVDGALYLLHTSYEPVPGLLESARRLLTAACKRSTTRQVPELQTAAR